MFIASLIGRQAQRPSGFVGRILVRFMGRMTAEYASWTFERMDIQPGDSVLEVGFGGGKSLKMLAERLPNGSVTGVEASPDMVQMAAKSNRGLVDAGRMKLVHGDAAKLPLEDAAFDKACTINTVYVLPDLPTVFGELNRVLKPGGTVAITFPVRERFMSFRPTRTPGFHFHELNDVTSALEKAGFQEVRNENTESGKFGINCLIGTKPAA